MRNLLLVIVPKRPRIPVKVAETFILILIESGVVFLASVVIPVVFDRGSPVVIILGVLAVLVFWSAAIVISWRLE